MDVAEAGQILHSISDATQHGDQLQAGETILVILHFWQSRTDRKLVSVRWGGLGGARSPNLTHPQVGVQRLVLHVLHHDHRRLALGDHALQVDDVRVLELAHDRGLDQQVEPGALAGARLEGLDGHARLGAGYGGPEAGQTDVAELA